MVHVEQSFAVNMKMKGIDNNGNMEFESNIKQS
jgi:hypothetical protein